jgi:hypothetical protein
MRVEAMAKNIFEAFRGRTIHLEHDKRGFVGYAAAQASEQYRDDLRGLCSQYTKAADVATRAAIENKMVALLTKLTTDTEVEDEAEAEVAASFGGQRIQPFAEWVEREGLAR